MKAEPNSMSASLMKGGMISGAQLEVKIYVTVYQGDAVAVYLQW